MTRKKAFFSGFVLPWGLAVLAVLAQVRAVWGDIIVPAREPTGVDEASGVTNAPFEAVLRDGGPVRRLAESMLPAGGPAAPSPAEHAITNLLAGTPPPPAPTNVLARYDDDGTLPEPEILLIDLGRFDWIQVDLDALRERLETRYTIDAAP